MYNVFCYISILGGVGSVTCRARMEEISGKNENEMCGTTAATTGEESKKCWMMTHWQNVNDRIRQKFHLFVFQSDNICQRWSSTIATTVHLHYSLTVVFIHSVWEHTSKWWNENSSGQPVNSQSIAVLASQKPNNRPNIQRTVGQQESKWILHSVTQQKIQFFGGDKGISIHCRVLFVYYVGLCIGQCPVGWDFEWIRCFIRFK